MVEPSPDKVSRLKPEFGKGTVFLRPVQLPMDASKSYTGCPYKKTVPSSEREKPLAGPNMCSSRLVLKMECTSHDVTLQANNFASLLR